MVKIVNNFKRTIDAPEEGIKTRAEKISIPTFFQKRLGNVLISEKCLKLRVKEMAKEISRGKKEIYLISILKGSAVFLADLIRDMDCDVEVDFLGASSYIGEKSSGKIKIGFAPFDAKGKNIILLEDIVDTGNTLSFLKSHLLKKEKAKSVKICVLLDKPARREKNIEIDFVGFRVPDRFTVGYGLDYKQRCRNLPFVATLKKY